MNLKTGKQMNWHPSGEEQTRAKKFINFSPNSNKKLLKVRKSDLRILTDEHIPCECEALGRERV